MYGRYRNMQGIRCRTRWKLDTTHQILSQYSDRIGHLKKWDTLKGGKPKLCGFRIATPAFLNDQT
jgi:hypothetical protein